ALPPQTFGNLRSPTALSIAPATASNLASLPIPANTVIPNGTPALSNPHGIATTGAPALPVHLAAAPIGAINTSHSCIDKAASIPAVRDKAMSRARSDR